MLVGDFVLYLKRNRLFTILPRILKIGLYIELSRYYGLCLSWRCRCRRGPKLRDFNIEGWCKRIVFDNFRCLERGLEIWLATGLWPWVYRLLITNNRRERGRLRLVVVLLQLIFCYVVLTLAIMPPLVVVVSLVRVAVEVLVVLSLVATVRIRVLLTVWLLIDVSLSVGILWVVLLLSRV